MVTLRCTQKLLKRLKANPERDTNLPDTKLGDWYANLIYIGREQLVLCISEKTFLPILLPAKDAASLPERFVQEAHWMLNALRIPASAIQTEIDAMQPLLIGRTVSRSVLGVMNEMAFSHRMNRAYGQESDLHGYMLYLSRVLFMPIKDHPDNETRKLFGLEPINPRW